MRFFRLSYIAAGSICAGSAFIFALPFVGAGCGWRTDPPGGAGAGPAGGGLGDRGSATVVVVVVVVVIAPFIAVCKRRLVGVMTGRVEVLFGGWLREFRSRRNALAAR